MSREQPELGERKPYVVRYKGNVGPCEGVDDSHDPSTVNDQGLVDLVNGYVHDGIVVSRGGQTAITNPLSPMSGCVYGMIEIDGGSNASPDWYLSVPHNDFLPFTLGSIDTWFTSIVDPTDAYTRVVGDSVAEVGAGEVGSYGPPALDVFDSTVSRFCFANWKGDVVIVSSRIDDAGTVFGVFKLIPTLDPTLPHRTKTEEIVKIPSGITPSSLVPLNVGGTEYLFLGTLGGGVLVTDGVSVLTSLAEGTLSGRVILASYHGTIYACANHEIRRLNHGTTSSWGGAISIPSGAFPTGVADFRPSCWSECYDELLIGGWDDNEPFGGCILKITESSSGVATVSIAHVPEIVVGGTPRYADFISDICNTFSGGDPIVFYSYQMDSGELTSSIEAIIGSYDGVSFTDNVAALSHPEGDPSVIGRMYSAANVVFVSGYSSSGVVSGNSEPGIFSDVLNRLISTFDAVGDSTSVAYDMIPI